MSNLSNQQEQEKLSSDRNSLKKVLKPTGNNEEQNFPNKQASKVYLDKQVIAKAKNSEQPTLETSSFECESRFILTKRNDSVILDQKDNARNKKSSAVLTSIVEQNEPINDFQDESWLTSS